MNKVTIEPYNQKGQKHGYCVRYWGDGTLSYKGMYINGVRIGYWVMHITSFDWEENYSNTYYII